LSTAVEKYLDIKKIDYYLDGENATFNCPFCEDSERKFGINVNNFLGQCFRGKCGKTVNEITFKRHFGDSVQTKSNLEDDDDVVQLPVAKKKSSVEAVPDIEAHHKKLLEDDEILNWLNDERGFSLDTVKQAKLGISKRNFGNGPEQALTFPYFIGPECIGVKYRSLPPSVKDFRYTAGKEVGIYNQNAIKKDMEFLCCVEGESDALALLNQGFNNVVGVPGCKSKNADWAELLDLPKKMYLIFDNDEAGQEGAKGFASRFGVNRFYNVVLPKYDLDVPVIEKGETRTTIKDINDWFLQGYTLEQFQQLLDKARPFDIEGVTTMESSFEEILKVFDDGGSLALPYEFKWAPVTARAKGLKKGDMVTILAAPKTGKTSLCLNQTEFMSATYDHNIHFSCFEMDHTELNKKWAALVLDVEEDKLTREQISEAMAIKSKRQSNFIYTRPHPETLEEYIATIKKVKARYGTDVLVVDNFQILVDLTLGRGEGNNRPNYMSKVSKTLKSLAHELDLVLFLISQPRNTEEGVMVTVNHSEGSGTLKMDSDLFFTLNRNAEAKMKMDQMASLGNMETNQSHSETMYVEVGLSRRSRGGFCTLKIDGSKSTIREFDSTETPSGQKKVMIDGMKIVDDRDPVTQI
jgi:KaiC/GvpD/RAD55 family RecA-like ATPase